MPEIEQISAAERLIGLLTPTDAAAEEQLKSWRESLEGADEYTKPAWILAQAIDWEYGYKVDWKDGDSFVRCMTAIASRWGAKLTFGTAEPTAAAFLSGKSVPELMALAHDELAPNGLTLWNWNTESDCFSGWISRSSAADEVVQRAEALGVEIRPANQPF